MFLSAGRKPLLPLSILKWPLMFLEVPKQVTTCLVRKYFFYDKEHVANDKVLLPSQINKPIKQPFHAR